MYQNNINLKAANKTRDSKHYSLTVVLTAKYGTKK